MDSGTTRPGRFDDFLAAELREISAQGKESYRQFAMPLARRVQEAWKLDAGCAHLVVNSYVRRQHPELLPARVAARPLSPLLGQFDAFLAATLEAEKQAGRKLGLIPVIGKLRAAKGIRLREAREVVEDYAARQCPELLASTAATLRQQGWLMAAGAVLLTALLWAMGDLSALSVSVVPVFWNVAATSLAEAYWVKAEIARYRLVWGVGSALYLALGVWVLCSPEELSRWFGFVWLAVGLGTGVMALRKQWL